MAETTVDPLASAIRDVAAQVETARAKINLALHVVGRRVDGYHLLDSLVVFADMGDTLRATPIDDALTKLTLDGLFGDALRDSGRPQDNLIVRAADELAAAFPQRRRGGTRIHLTKLIPLAAGLGGGSADAAAALRLLDRYHDLRAGPARLAEIGLRLGADVPLCLVSRPLRAEGIGERTTLVKGLPSLPVVLVNPGVAVRTAHVFSRLPNAERTPMWPLPERFANLIEFAQWLRMTRNDLYQPATEEERLVAVATKAVASDPDCLFARMSGSGASVFGIFNTNGAAERAAARITAARPGWWVVATRTGAS